MFLSTASVLGTRVSGTARRAGTVLVTLLGLLALTFFIGRVMPLDPVLAVVGPGLLQQWRDRLPADTPNYFLMNIQPDQRQIVLDALTAQQAGAIYNFIAFLGALALIPVVKRFGARHVHAVCLAASGAAMLMIPGVSTPAALFALMLGIGIGWAGMMGNTYVMLADCIPADRTGTYMGIFNMFIVIPMLIQSLTMPLIYRPLLGGDPRNVLLLGGVLMIMGAAATLFIKAGNRAPVERKSFGG